jgi:hypothetical protein
MRRRQEWEHYPRNDNRGPVEPSFLIPVKQTVSLRNMKALGLPCTFGGDAALEEVCVLTLEW